MKSILNECWVSSTGGEYLTERSDFGSGLILDPWNRPIMADNLVKQFDSEGELTHWTCHTNIEGVPVKLIIYND